jgi:hypothetical protein
VEASTRALRNAALLHSSQTVLAKGRSYSKEAAAFSLPSPTWAPIAKSA